MMIDLWRRLHEIFNADDVDNPEIRVDNLSDSGMRGLIAYLLENSRELSTELYTFTSEGRIYPHSIQGVIDDLAGGRLMGMIGMELMIRGVTLPPLGFITDEPGYMSIVYQMGLHWTPMILMTLFELFTMIMTIDNDAVIGLNGRYFGKSRQTLFASTLRDYMNEKHSPE